MLLIQRFTAICVLLLSAPLLAVAQSYPTRPIRMLVPAAAAGVTDIAARVLTPRLAEALGQSVVVENRAGAGGIIGTDIAAKAAPDGHTLLTAFDSFVSNPFVFKKVPYDTLKDFAPIALLIRGPQIFVATPKLGVKTFADFAALARAKPGSVRYATAGAATSSRLSVELFKSISKLDGPVIFFKGGGPALNDLLGGHVDVMIASAGLVLPHTRSGRLHALAVSSRHRTALAPGVPSVSEFYPLFEAQSWVGMLAPARRRAPSSPGLMPRSTRCLLKTVSRIALTRWATRSPAAHPGCSAPG